jgi:hypothetical protein
MATEKFSDHTAATTLTSGITNVATTLTVASSAGLPTAANFALKIESEEVLVTDVSSAPTYTVTRGVGGTTAAAHSSGVSVRHVVTHRSFDQRSKDNVTFGTSGSRPTNERQGKIFIPTDDITFQVDDGTNWNAWGPINKFTSTKIADWTAENHAGATSFVNSGTGVFLSEVSAGGGVKQWRSAWKTQPTKPYTIVAHLSLFNVWKNDEVMAGIGFRKSSDGKMVFIGNFINTGNSMFMGVYYYSSNTVFDHSNGDYGSPFGLYSWFRIRDDNTNRYFEVSSNGRDWFLLFSEGNTAYATFDQVGFGMRVNGVSGNRYQMAVNSWDSF